MDAKIFYFYIFGIITVTTGKPSNYYGEDSNYGRNTYDLGNILQSLAEQGKLDVASNYREDTPNLNYVKPSPLIYKVDSPQYYEPDEKANVEQPNVNELQMINQLLKQNGVELDSNNAKNLLEGLLTLESNNKIQSLKSNDDTSNVDEIVALLGELQRISDDGNNRDYKDYDNLRDNLFYEENDKPNIVRQDKSKQNMVKSGKIRIEVKPEIRDIEYLNLDDELSGKSTNNRDSLRCSGKTCARTNALNDDNNTRLRCQGRYCTRTNDNTPLKYGSKLPAKKIKLTDELSAYLLRVSDVDNSKKMVAPQSFHTNQLKGIENLLNSRSKDNVEAIVFDLTKVENGDEVARQIKRLLSQNDGGSYDEYEEYGNLIENNLKQGIYELQIPVDTGSANLKKKNNNAYAPQWVLDIAAKANGKYSEGDQVSRSLFPLTRQQKERMNKKRHQKAARVFRRSFDQDVGVPFHMEVEGLGLVKP